MSSTIDTPRIGIIGLGYVGLPLAVAFAEPPSKNLSSGSAERFPISVIGVDIIKLQYVFDCLELL